MKTEILKVTNLYGELTYRQINQIADILDSKFSNDNNVDVFLELEPEFSIFYDENYYVYTLEFDKTWYVLAEDEPLANILALKALATDSSVLSGVAIFNLAPVNVSFTLEASEVKELLKTEDVEEPKTTTEWISPETVENARAILRMVGELQ